MLLIPWRGRIRAMATAVTVRADFSADELRRLAAASKHANQSRRLLSLAAVLDGVRRADASRRPSASASLTTSARSARSSSSSASRTSARVRAIRPRTRRPWRLLKKLRRDAEHSPCRPAEGQADRDLVPDAMRADTTGLNVQSGRRPQPNRGARHHAALMRLFALIPVDALYPPQDGGSLVGILHRVDWLDPEREDELA